MSSTVADQLLERLSQWGVKRVFGYPGDGINGIMGAMGRRAEAFDYIRVRHEEMAAFMAGAHAKFTGEVGVCLATSGPGAIHLLNGLYDARMDHQPVLAIVGQQAATALGSDYQQEVDLQSLFKDVSAYVETVVSPAQLLHVLDRALRVAVGERQVATVIVPNDVQQMAAPKRQPHEHGHVMSAVGFVQPRPYARDADLEAAAAILNRGRRVAIAAAPTWEYQEDRMMYGISANMPIGDWAVGTELSYRPKDSVMLNPVIDLCTGNGGKCWKDEKKFQWHLTGLYSFTPSNSPTLLDFSGASTGSLLTELVVIKYPGLHDEVNGEPLAAGLNAWQLDPARAPKSRGDKTSSGINLDFSLTYDGTLLPGWQVTPGVFYARSLGGRTPNLSATFTEDASSMNLYLNFVRNPASWQISLNYAKFMGGETPYDQLYRDRDYVGIAISRTL
ncbi:TPA: DUF1302 family protein [Pseudomonas aeruginosa]